jgi:inner membrane protein
MDNLTHTLFGAALGEAGLRRRSPLATPVLLIGANLPDIDIAAAFFGHTLSFRRGWTHGVLAVVILPLLLTGATLAWDAWVRRRRHPAAPAPQPFHLAIVAFVAVLSHPFLDWLNNYGLRWLMPFDGTWFYGDALFIIDPWLWILMILGVIAGRRASSPRIGFATISVVMAYIAGMLVTAVVGRDLVRNEVARLGIGLDEIMVGPMPLDPNRRQVIIRDRDIYFTGTLRLLPRFELRLDDRVVARNDGDPAAVAASTLPEVRRFLTWSRFPFFVVTSNDNFFTVRVDDLRYSDRARGSFATVNVVVPRQR